VTVAIGYLRVSTEEQAESRAGLEAQRAAILAEAERRGWTEVKFIEDAGYGGGNLTRPGLAEALNALAKKRADTLVVSKLDRLSRSLLDFAGLMNRASREHWALVALDLGVDTTTPAGEMVANVIMTFAQFERRLIGQRTKDALAAKKRSGVRLGRPTLLPEDLRARIAADYDAGATMQSIAAQLTAEGVPTAQGGRWHASTVRSVLGQVGMRTRRRGPPRR
jgi:DNA invertase Pin-like site-specific DNA recombinase